MNMFDKNVNDKPFEYVSHNGTQFHAKRCDFNGGIQVILDFGDFGCNSPRYSEDLAEMIGYHATNIWPNLNGFQGYDCIDFKF